MLINLNLNLNLVHYTFYTVFAHTDTSFFVNLKYAYTAMVSSVVSGEDLVFPQNDCQVRQCLVFFFWGGGNPASWGNGSPLLMLSHV